MLIKIKRQDALNNYQAFPVHGYDYDKDEEKFFYPKVFKSYILTLPSKSFKVHAKVLGAELNKLTMALHADALIFLGDTKTPWLHQTSENKPIKEAQEYLIDKKVGKRFNGALKVNTFELPTFIKHLAWLTRYNAALPYFYFTDQMQNIIGNICQYGNLHLDTLNEQANKVFNSYVGGSKFKYGDNNSCYNWFSRTSAISGRQSNL